MKKTINGCSSEHEAPDEQQLFAQRTKEFQSWPKPTVPEKLTNKWLDFRDKLIESSLMYVGFGTEFANVEIAKVPTHYEIFFNTLGFMVTYQNVYLNEEWKSRIEFALRLQTFLRDQREKFVVFNKIVQVKEAILGHILEPRLVPLKHAFRDDPFPYPLNGIISQLIDAASYLHSMGVAHRYIRENSILLSQGSKTPNVKLSTFICACSYWSVETKSTINQKKTVLRDSPEVDHLPPECFTDDYDASNVDCWSIGVILSLMITRCKPFDTSKPGLMLLDWHDWSERASFPHQYRTILDTIFQLRENRVSLWTLKNDQVLRNPESPVDTAPHQKSSHRAVSKESHSSSTSGTSLTKTSNSSSSLSSFASASHFARTPSKLDLVKDQLMIERIERMIKSDNLRSIDSLKAENITFDEEQVYDAPPNRAQYTLYGNWNDKSVEIKTIMLKNVPALFQRFILKENHRILLYLSKQTDLPDALQKVLEIVHLKKQSKVIYLYEPFKMRSSVSTLMLGKQLTSKEYSWILRDLFDLMLYFGKLGLAHRYIRPENVFFVEGKQVKLGYSELMCLTMNPEKGKTLRSKGLQDEQYSMQNHLPPECFEPHYDASKVDIWSWAVLAIYLFTGGHTPIDPRRGVAACQAALASLRYSNAVIELFWEFFDQIFVLAEDRIVPIQMDFSMKIMF